MPVTRRAVDGDAAIHEPFAGVVDVLHPIGEMTEVAATFVVLGVPIVGELHHRRLILLRALEIVRRTEKDEREAPALILDAAHFFEAQQIAIEMQRRLEGLHPDHGVQITHDAVPYASASISASVRLPGTMVTGMG